MSNRPDAPPSDEPDRRGVRAPALGAEPKAPGAGPEPGGGGISADQVYRTLRNTIVEGQLSAGTRLVEETTARQLGVSRTPVREAIFRLESERLVTRDPRGGAIVADLSPEEIEEIYAVRSALEGLTARLAGRMMSQRDFVRLEHVQANLEAAAAEERFEDLAQLNLKFHEVILKSTRNATLISFMDQIHASLRRVTRTTLAYPGRAAAAMEEHRSLMKALTARDLAAAERVAREHIDNAFNIRILLNLSEETG